MKLRLCITLICVLFVLVGRVGAQTTATVRAVTVDHSIPFGTVPGKLLLLGNYLVFLDEQPSASFVATKTVIESLNADSTVITVQTNEAIPNRSGEVRRLSFRAVSSREVAVVTQWYGGGVAHTSSVTPAAVSATDTPTYEARHNHRFGECRWRLIIGLDRVSHKSVSSVSDSRRGEYNAIKEKRFSNPYEIESELFTSDEHQLHFDAVGIDPASHSELVDQVTHACTTR